MVVAKEIVYKKSSGGLLVDADKILLIHWDKPRGSYDFPKGGVDPGETSEEACVREVYEETGYKTRIISPLGQTAYEYDWHDGTYHKKTVDYYLLQKETKETHAREPHETFTEIWCPLEKARELLTRDIDKVIFDKAIEELRTH